MCAEVYSLDVGLVEGEQGTVDGDAHCGEVEVVEEDRHMVVQALGGSQVQLQHALTDALQLLLLIRPATERSVSVSTQGEQSVHGVSRQYTG